MKIIAIGAVTAGGKTTVVKEKSKTFQNGYQKVQMFMYGTYPR